MSRPRHCAVCVADPAIRAQIDAQLTAGVSIKAIVGQHPNFSRDQVSRHRSRCLVPAVAPEIATDVGSAEIRTWLSRAESTYLAAQSLGDTKSAISAISAAVRSLTALSKQQKVEAAAAVKESDGSGLTVAQCDEALRAFRANRREDWCYYCNRSWPKGAQEKTNTDAHTT